MTQKALIIAEKPSVARDIIRALGGFQISEPHTIAKPQLKSKAKQESRGASVWESEHYVCTHALGHLLDLYEPEDYNPNYKNWRLQDLPVIPARFLLKPKSETAPLLRTLKQLLARPDIGSVINACDAAREGELIFREIIEYAQCVKPIQRVWLQSLTEDAIRAAFAHIRSGDDYRGLAAAANGRSQADWLVGMNLSRALTLKLARASEPGVWSVGRVQTPTLAMLVEREFQILAHDPRPFQLLKAKFKAPDHEYEGTWFDPNYTKEHPDERSRASQIFSSETAEFLKNALKAGDPCTASETRKTREQAAPLLFNLTALQRHMSSRYKWTAKQTLSAAQRCYEQHKVLTYPRTESDALPEDYRDKLKSVFKRLETISDYEALAVGVNNAPWQNEKKIFDDKRVGDHFAIIPTGVFPPQLPTEDGLLFDAVIRRTLAAVMPPAKIDHVERITIVKSNHFKSGPEEFVREPGWQAATGVTNRKTGLSLKPISPETVITFQDSELKSEQTKPLPRIGEGQLLSMMEFAGRQVDDAETARILYATGGLGTAATRAEIIENLKSKNYVFPNLQPTVKGMHLIRYLRLARAEKLTSPMLTGEMESHLAEIETGKRTRELFMDELASDVRSSLEAVDRFDLTLSFHHAPALGSCPRCSLKTSDGGTKASIHERMWNYTCSSNFSEASACGFTLPKDLDGRYLDPATVKRLLEADDQGILVEGFPSTEERGGTEQRRLKFMRDHLEVLSKSGAALTAKLHTSSDNSSSKKRVTWGPCPVHKGDSCLIVETKAAFICETRIRLLRSGEEASNGFYLPKTVCGRALKFDEINSFIQNGRTKKIEGFTSKGGKSFAASIVRAPSGQWGLEF